MGSRQNYTTSSISVLLWNINGILNRLQELEFALHERRIDVALITETHLTSQSFLRLNGYSVYRADNPTDRPHGGALVLVKSSLAQYPTATEPPTNYLQGASAAIVFQNFDIVMAAVYCPPAFRITDGQFKQFFEQLGPRFLVGGDFNAKHPLWRSRLTTPRGRNLYRVINENRYSAIAPDSPTYWPTAHNRIPDVIDFFVSFGLNNMPVLTQSEDNLLSDHSAILLTLNAGPVPIIQRRSLINKHTDWESFRVNMDVCLRRQIPLRIPIDIENAVEHFNKSIISAARISTPIMANRNYGGPNYPQYIRRIIQEKRRARHRWQRYRQPEDRIHMNRLSNHLKEEIIKFKTENYEEYLSNLSEENNSIWRATKRILKWKATPSPLRRADGSWAKSDGDKADQFAEHLKKVFTTNQDFGNNSDADITNALTTHYEILNNFEPIQTREVENEVAQLPLRKSPGYDLIAYEMIQNLPASGIVFITQLFNTILRIKHFPIQWKMSLISMILKPNKSPHLTASYRPVSLLPVLSKLFEKVLLPRILNFLEDANVIPQHQFGFRKSHSTIHQLHRVVDYISESLEKRMYCTGIFLDVQAAFDKVWHNGLLYKIKRVIPDPYYSVLFSFIKNRSFKVRQGQTCSTAHAINAGVPQGAILSPTLYSLFTADLPVTDNTLTATYADDSAILSRGDTPEEASNYVQQHLLHLEIWLTKWKIKINNDKSIQVTFSLRTRSCPQLHLYGQPIPNDNKVRYLGLLLDRRLTWQQHISSKRTVLNQRLKQLWHVIRPKSTLPLRLKLLIYRSLLRPIWTYGIPLFGVAKKSNLNKLQTFQNKFLRIIAKAPYYVRNDVLHHDLKMKTVCEIAVEHYGRFFHRMAYHQNLLIRGIRDTNLPTVRRLKRKWCRDLLL